MVDTAVPESPKVPFGGVLGNVTHTIGFDAGKVVKNRGLLRKTVDYGACMVRMLENRVWQRDSRDIPVIQPDATYFNEVVPPAGLQENPVNAVTTKFVRASTNKVRCPIFCTSWVPDGRRLITGAVSGEFTLWNGLTFNFESILQGHDCPVRSMEWSHNGTWMVTTDDRGFVKYWQSNMNNVHTFQAHSDPVRSSSLSPTDAKLATCSDDGTVRIFDFIRCSEEFILRGHGADVKSVDWHPRKNLLVSGSKDNQQPVKLWDPKAGQSVATIHAHKATVMSVNWNQNGNWLLTASRDHLIKVYDIRAMKEMYTLKGHKKDVNTLAWHPVHESLFASGGSDGSILFWLVGSEREVGGMESAHDSFIWSLSWHPLGHILCSGSNDHTSKFWCRNRPGDEMKDKYNQFSNSLLAFSDEVVETEVYSLPGMGAAKSGGSFAITLPPPSSNQNSGDAITLPPPQTSKNWQRQAPEGTTASNNSVQKDSSLNMDIGGIPVLGADIIAEQFGDSVKKPSVANLGNQPQNQPPSVAPPNLNQRPFDSGGRGDKPPFLAPHEQAGVRGPPPVPSPGERIPPQQQGPPNRFRHPSDHGREWMGGDFGRPGPGDFPPLRRPGEFGERGRPGPFSWQRVDYRERRPSYEEERRFPPELPPHNPYVYRRADNEPRDPRTMAGDPRRAAASGGHDRGQGWSRGELPREQWPDEPRRGPPALQRPGEEFPDRGLPPPHRRGPPDDFGRQGDDFRRDGRFGPPTHPDRHHPPPSEMHGGPPPPERRENAWPPHDRPQPQPSGVPQFQARPPRPDFPFPRESHHPTEQQGNRPPAPPLQQMQRPPQQQYPPDQENRPPPRPPQPLIAQRPPGPKTTMQEAERPSVPNLRPSHQQHSALEPVQVSQAGPTQLHGPPPMQERAEPHQQPHGFDREYDHRPPLQQPPGGDRPGPQQQFGPQGGDRPGPHHQFGPPGSERPHPHHQFGPPGGDRPHPQQQFGPPGSDRSHPPGSDHAHPQQQFGPPGGDRPHPQQQQFGPPGGDHPHPQQQFGPPGGDRPHPQQQFGPPGSDRSHPQQQQFRPSGGDHSSPQQQQFGPPRGDHPSPHQQQFGPPRGDQQFGPPRGDHPLPQQQQQFGPPTGLPRNAPPPQQMQQQQRFDEQGPPPSLRQPQQQQQHGPPPPRSEPLGMPSHRFEGDFEHQPPHQQNQPPSERFFQDQQGPPMHPRPQQVPPHTQEYPPQRFAPSGPQQRPTMPGGPQQPFRPPGPPPGHGGQFGGPGIGPSQPLFQPRASNEPPPPPHSLHPAPPPPRNVTDPRRQQIPPPQQTPLQPHGQYPPQGLQPPHPPNEQFQPGPPPHSEHYQPRPGEQRYGERVPPQQSHDRMQPEGQWAPHHVPPPPPHQPHHHSSQQHQHIREERSEEHFEHSNSSHDPRERRGEGRGSLSRSRGKDSSSRERGQQGRSSREKEREKEREKDRKDRSPNRRRHSNDRDNPAAKRSRTEDREKEDQRSKSSRRSKRK